MRQVAPFLLCIFALTAGAAEIWRWRDANGVVHYSDNPRPGAERITVNAPRPSGDGPAAQAELPAESGVAVANPDVPVSYRSCIVLSPQNDQTFFGVQAIDVALSVQPGLQNGHRIQVLANGAVLPAWPATAVAYTLPEVVRGSHTLAVRILDQNGRTVCTAPPITFHLRQNSVLPPAGQPPPRPPATVPTPRPQPGG
jgi:hypothetical protein